MNKNQSVYKEGMAILKNMGEKHNLLYNRIEPRSTTDGESSGYNPPKRVRIPLDLQHYLKAESPSQLRYYNTYGICTYITRYLIQPVLLIRIIFPDSDTKLH
jgi:hypothetical protein